ncbi:hypothetical protein GCM10027416_12350 [Okibacterium endophyticum]
MSDPENTTPDEERFITDDERSAPSPGIDDQREVAPDPSDAGEEPSLQEHHNPETEEDTVSGGPA